MLLGTQGGPEMSMVNAFTSLGDMLEVRLYLMTLTVLVRLSVLWPPCVRVVVAGETLAVAMSALGSLSVTV